MILVFKNTRDVILAEKLLKQELIELEIIPTPRNISSECGMSIRIKKETKIYAEKILNTNGIVIANCIIEEKNEY